MDIRYNKDMTATLTPLHPKVILGVVAHPDDFEVCFGGSVATWIAQGAKAYCYVLTDGANGTSDPGITPDQLRTMRQAEQQDAATILGVSGVEFATNKDGLLLNSVDVRRDIVRMIRRIKPDVVLSFDPSMLYSVENGIINHPDHRAVGQATLDCVFPLARDHLSFPELLDEGLTPHVVPTILLSNFSTSNFYVDISGVIDTKIKALGAHASQIADISEMGARMKSMAADTATHCDMEYAEGFVRIDIS